MADRDIHHSHGILTSLTGELSMWRGSEGFYYLYALSSTKGERVGGVNCDHAS